MTRSQVKTKFWLLNKEKPLIGKGKAELLKSIEKEGSLNKACKQLHISYKHAWLQIKEIEEALEEPVLTTKRGGKTQGSILTPKTKQLLHEYDNYQNLLNQTIHDTTFWEMINLKISARNQLKGTITKVEKDNIVAKIKIDIQPTTITAVITKEAAETLNLQENDNVTAIIKATEIMIGKEE